MPDGVKGRGFFDILIDDKKLPYIQQFVNSMSIIENLSQAVPILIISTNDFNNIFQSDDDTNGFALTDANKFSVKMGTDPETSDKDFLEFRTFSTVTIPSVDGYSTKLDCILDLPKYTQGSPMLAFNSNSNDVVSQVAKQAGGTLDNAPNTNDKMAWLNPAQTLATFLEEVVTHSYVSDTGLMKLAVTSDKKFHYVDVFAELKKPSKNKFKYGAFKIGQEEVEVKDIRFFTNSGFMNSWLGYGYYNLESMLDGTTKRAEGISISTDGNVAINEDVYNQMDSVRVDYAPHDCGNTHDKYWESYHNNLRKSTLLSQGVILQIEEFTEFSVLDTLDLTINNMFEEDEIADNRNGTYIITAKRRTYSGNQYVEQFEAHRIAIKKKGKSKVIGSDSKLESGRQDENLGSAPTSQGEYTTDDLGSSYHGLSDVIKEDSLPSSSDSTTFDKIEDFTDAGDGTATRGEYENAKVDLTNGAESTSNCPTNVRSPNSP